MFTSRARPKRVYHPFIGNLFATTGMATMSVMILLLALLSVGFMVLLIQVFHRADRNQRQFIRSFLPEDASFSSHPRIGQSVLLWVYILLTLVMTGVSLALFLFQPHLL